MGDSNARNM